MPLKQSSPWNWDDFMVRIGMAPGGAPIMQQGLWTVHFIEAHNVHRFTLVDQFTLENCLLWFNRSVQ